jgi:hypothetical protein
MENSDESLSTPPKGAKDLALMTRRRQGKTPWGNREENPPRKEKYSTRE